MSLDGTKLQFDLEEGERWRRTLNVTVPADLVELERSNIAKKLAARIKLPGFRKGHIPKGVLEKRFGAALNQETLDAVIGDAFREVLTRQSVRPISEGEVQNVRFEPDQDLTFSISFDVQPEFEISRMGGFTVERPTIVVDDEQVEQVVQRLREQNSTWVPSSDGRPEPGNVVSVEIERLEEESDGEVQPYEFILGEGEAIPDIEEAILSLEVGASGDFIVKFPDDFANEERRGEEQHLRIELTGRRVQDLPEADDPFAASLGDFESMADLRSKLRKDLEKEAKDQEEGAIRGQLLDFVVDANPFSVPESMVERYMSSILGNANELPPEKLAEMKEKLAPETERAVKRILVIDRIADGQGLRATEAELDERIESIAERAGQTPTQVYGNLQRNDRIGALEREITETKVFDFLKEQSEIEEA
ncbi:MAG: trigger factor [Gemmatimonadota bacterium]|nr:MAG: trigger factor [Gemmatimonadota bacterium]